jgi:predicted alpha/beta-hydrolase family hydrolase
LILPAGMLAGCVASGADRDAAAAAIAHDGGLAPAIERGTSFDLQLYRRDSAAPGPLFVYIEGDGAAYLDPHAPSADPTPIDPLALRLAAADLGSAVVYVARPCQFAPGRGDRRCAVADWTNRRFSPEAVAAVNDVVEREHARAPARPLVLVGYSGGGVIAALVAARRSDVALLITLAAPLDLAGWTNRLGLSPLTGSRAPLDDATTLAQVRQVDFAGERDATVPVETIRGAVEKLQPGAKPVVVPEFDHRCCWLRDWPQLRDAAGRSAFPAN